MHASFLNMILGLEEAPLILYPDFFVIVLVRLRNWILTWLHWRILIIAKDLLKQSIVGGARVSAFLFLIVGFNEGSSWRRGWHGLELNGI